MAGEFRSLNAPSGTLFPVCGSGISADVSGGVALLRNLCLRTLFLLDSRRAGALRTPDGTDAQSAPRDLLFLCRCGISLYPPLAMVGRSDLSDSAGGIFPEPDAPDGTCACDPAGAGFRRFSALAAGTPAGTADPSRRRSTPDADSFGSSRPPGACHQYARLRSGTGCRKLSAQPGNYRGRRTLLRFGKTRFLRRSNGVSESVHRPRTALRRPGPDQRSLCAESAETGGGTGASR